MKIHVIVLKIPFQHVVNWLWKFLQLLEWPNWYLKLCGVTLFFNNDVFNFVASMHYIFFYWLCLYRQSITRNFLLKKKKLQFSYISILNTKTLHNLKLLTIFLNIG